MKIATIRTKLFPAWGKKAKVPSANASAKDMGILDHIEKVVEITGAQGIDKCQIKGKAHLDYIAGKLGVSHLQATLFSHLVERSMGDRVEIGELAEAIKCSKLRIIKYTGDCEELEKKKLIRCRRHKDSVSYWVPRGVTESIRKHNEFRLEKKDSLTIEEFFADLESVFEEREEEALTWEIMRQELQNLVYQNMHLAFCQKLVAYNFSEEDAVLLLCFCHLCANNSDDNIGGADIEFLYDSKVDFRKSQTELSDGFHTLMNANLVCYANSNGFADRDRWKVSEEAKKELLSELRLGNRNYKNRLVPHAGIKLKQMFYNPRETAEVQKLASLLREENYQKIQERLEGKGMRKGFACLFSGEPGTGKTETAYQIAREAGRDIMMVDISETKSMWYGESEKKIKDIFDTYRSAVDNSAIAPILLFNEADAIIGKRKESSRSSHSVDQTENTIQNIILQEMENLSGILIATTNLAQNMDSAFERRFLYKIIFDKPSEGSRAAIWKALFPDMPEGNATELFRRFELSGGQIENIARKTEVDGIINGECPSMETLAQYCKAELQNGFGVSEKRVGFCSG